MHDVLTRNVKEFWSQLNARMEPRRKLRSRVVASLDTVRGGSVLCFAFALVLLVFWSRNNRLIVSFSHAGDWGLGTLKHWNHRIYYQVVKSIWSGGQIVLYGSCYTGLDLPSSDVDIVVCGVGTGNAVPAPASSAPEFVTSAASAEAEEASATASSRETLSVTATAIAADTTAAAAASMSRSGSGNSSGGGGHSEKEGVEALVGDMINAAIDTASQQAQVPSHGMHSRGAEAQQAAKVKCIRRLAEALRHELWVVDLKAIETASIPVIKLQVDPLRCDDKGQGKDQSNKASSETGAVELFPVDISFEGPEHAGISSSRLVSSLFRIRWESFYPNLGSCYAKEVDMWYFHFTFLSV